MNCDVFMLCGNRTAHNRTYVAIIKQRIIETLFIASIIIEVASVCVCVSYSDGFSGFLFITNVIMMYHRYSVSNSHYGATTVQHFEIRLRKVLSFFLDFSFHQI